MKKNRLSLLLVLIIVSALFFSGCASVTGNVTTNEKDQKLEEKEMAYDFMLLDLSGNTHNLSDYQGKKVYIKFWGTWCPVCVSGLNELTALDEQLKDSDTVVLTIVAPGISGEMSEEKFKDWYSKQGYSFEVLLDPTAESFIEYGIRAFPTSAFVASDGTLSAVKIGHQSNDAIKDILESMD
ncbi:MAG: TlpA family protein disulfide reductase [Clostridia bacterium]|nr:TlpA family protein disulfide reductase [Clostridia bacterium]